MSAAARRRTVSLAAIAWLSGCANTAQSPPPPMRYVLGEGYQGDGVWFYPRESLSYDETGIADITPPGHAALTTDNELYDPTALAGAHQTLQLPAIVRVTNLQSGRQILLRLNDRGPSTPARLRVTPRAAELLAFGPDGTALVRVQIEAEPSQALMDQLHGGEARLALNAAPVGAVQADTLAPPSGVQMSPRVNRVAASPALVQEASDRPAAAPPLRLPEYVQQLPVSETALWIDAGHFGVADYANRRAAQLFASRARVERTRIGNQSSFRVRIGPLPSVAEADATLDQVVHAGVTDARIVVEQD
jgi:rare lipoprotein A